MQTENHYAMLAHFQTNSICVMEGQHVKAGELLGRVGHSGNSTAPHLHFQLMDRADLLTAKGFPVHLSNTSNFRMVNGRKYSVVSLRIRIGSGGTVIINRKVEVALDKSIINNSKKGRKIIEEGDYRLLTVSSPEDLKVICSPQRQRILKILHTAGKPLHGKEIADCIGIKAPSAHFHLRKLEEVGAIRISHTQNINGITATYYEPAVDDIITGEDFLISSDDEKSSTKLLFAANVFNLAKNSFIKVLGKKLRDNERSINSSNFATLLNKILYLSPEDTKLFTEEMEVLLKKYTDFSSDKQPYDMLLSISEIGSVHKEAAFKNKNN